MESRVLSFETAECPSIRGSLARMDGYVSHEEMKMVNLDGLCELLCSRYSLTGTFYCRMILALDAHST